MNGGTTSPSLMFIYYNFLLSWICFFGTIYFQCKVLDPAYVLKCVYEKECIQ